MRLISQPRQVRKDYKIVVIADGSVNKSELMTYYAEANIAHSYIKMVGMDFRFKELTYNGSAIKLQIFDTAGQERFQDNPQVYLRGAHVVLLVYNVDSEESFRYVSEWLSNMRGQDLGMAVCIAANHCLTQNRKVTVAEGQALAKHYKCDFLEISTQSMVSINYAFQSLVVQLETPDTLACHQEDRTQKLTESFEKIKHQALLKAQEAKLFPKKLAATLLQECSFPTTLVLNVLDYVDTYCADELSEIERMLYDMQAKKEIVDQANIEDWAEVEKLCVNAIEYLGEAADSFYHDYLARCEAVGRFTPG